MNVKTVLTMIHVIVTAGMLWYLCGCAGTVVHVVPINLHDTGKQVVKAVAGDKTAEVTLLRIEF
jgi:hypothetical protein